MAEGENRNPQDGGQMSMIFTGVSASKSISRQRKTLQRATFRLKLRALGSALMRLSSIWAGQRAFAAWWSALDAARNASWKMNFAPNVAENSNKQKRKSWRMPAFLCTKLHIFLRMLKIQMQMYIFNALI